MSEIVGAFVRAELWDEGANCAREFWQGSRRDLAQKCLEFAVWQLDRIKVRRVFGKIPQARLRLLNRLPYGGSHVNSAVVHHDNVVAPKRRNQALLNIGEEHFSGHRSFDHHRCGHFIMAQGRHEGDRLP